MKLGGSSMFYSILLCFSIHAIAAPIAPTLTYDIEYYPEGPTVGIFWNNVPGATKYKLLYAPVPYTGPQSIGSIDVEPVAGAQSYYYAELYYAELPKAAAFYIAVQAGDDTGFSGYSNIESVTTVPPGPINLAGNWTASGNITINPANTCNTIPAGEINGIVAINQLQDSVTMTLPTGTSLSGTIVEDELNVIGYPSIGGNTQIMVISFSIASDNRNMRGVGGIGNSADCGGVVNLFLSR